MEAETLFYTQLGKNEDTGKAAPCATKTISVKNTFLIISGQMSRTLFLAGRFSEICRFENDKFLIKSHFSAIVLEMPQLFKRYAKHASICTLQVKNMECEDPLCRSDDIIAVGLAMVHHIYNNMAIAMNQMAVDDHITLLTFFRRQIADYFDTALSLRWRLRGCATDLLRDTTCMPFCLLYCHPWPTTTPPLNTRACQLARKTWTRRYKKRCAKKSRKNRA